MEEPKLYCSSDSGIISRTAEIPFPVRSKLSAEGNSFIRFDTESIIKGILFAMFYPVTVIVVVLVSTSPTEVLNV